MITGVNTAGTVGINHQTKWKKIDENTPRGVKLQLISRKYGVAQYSIWTPADKFFTHYFEVPTFDKDEE